MVNIGFILLISHRNDHFYYYVVIRLFLGDSNLLNYLKKNVCKHVDTIFILLITVLIS